MDDQQISRDMTRGQQARDLMESPLLQEAFTTIEKEIFDLWQATKTGEAPQREEAWLTLRAMKLLKLKLESIMNSGKIAKAELEKAQKKK